MLKNKNICSFKKAFQQPGSKTVYGFKKERTLGVQFSGHTCLVSEALGSIFSTVQKSKNLDVGTI